MNKNISILGMPLHAGQPKKGTHLGPNALREAGLIKTLSDLGYNVTDCGDIELGEEQKSESGAKLKNLDYIKNVCEELADGVTKIIVNKEFPFLLGGDHSMAIGTIAGLAKRYKNLGVIWFDAHGDLNTEDTSPSGNIHGMPLAISLGLGEKSLVEIGGLSPKVKIENVVLIGCRDLDAGEVKLINEKGIKLFDMDDIKKLGIEVITKQALAHLNGCDGIHLSYDVDAISPDVIPGTGTTVEGGLSYVESVKMLEVLKDSNKITSLELVEVNPLLEVNESDKGLTAKNAVGIIKNLF